MPHLAIHGGEPVRHPRKSWPSCPPAEVMDRAVELVTEVVRSGNWSTDGEKEWQFAEQFAAFSNVKYCVPVANGTVAIQLALEALDIGAYDEVIVPGLTWQATALACVDVNALPVFVDIDPETYCLDIDKTEAAITPRTRAIIVVHLFGAMADMDALLALARKHHLHMIEDCAHQHGSRWNDQGVGSLGDVGTFSFQQSKVLTSGEGGVTLTRDWDLFQRLYSLRHCGRMFSPTSPVVQGGNYRMTEMQAALLLAQMEQMEERVNHRDQMARQLSRRLSDIPGIYPMRRYPQVTRQSYYGFDFRYDASVWEDIPCAVFRKALAAETGLPVNTTYEPLNKSPFYIPQSKKRYHIDEAYWKALDPSQYDLPVCTRAYENEAVVIPHAFLLANQENIELVSDAVEKVYQYRDELKDVA
ncbi:MAG: DegT/DnrJ/EryC1/StrS family aminotransferase [Candidatus Latescibacteria bacterium]|jgi:L-glutamine:2-deoxy-scyllo-inosose/3-amino-2,3-dideoxy-scyllo-inosose aminotransferase|nr:DegT/DnrJ/EryC1/StrS family aminotransferase [Candidatus Latescibacterota bacterium]